MHKLLLLVFSVTLLGIPKTALAKSKTVLAILEEIAVVI